MRGKMHRRIGILFFGVCFFVILLSTHAFAKDLYKSISLKQNKAVKQKESAYDSKKGNTTYYRYQIKVPGDGYITVNMGRGKGSSIISLNKLLPENNMQAA